MKLKKISTRVENPLFFLVQLRKPNRTAVSLLPAESKNDFVSEAPTSYR
ncbi:MAG TPA: hypothetical protein VNM45_03335 [Bacillus sp. (in: firmicutes)]|nr:hypothetical protein [Bacillus sp. (in: firmicutes)]